MLNTLWDIDPEDTNVWRGFRDEAFG